MKPYMVVVSFLLYFILPTVDGKLLDLATLCPYNDFCTTKALKTPQPNETHRMPCCQKCSCEPDCELFGNCCPDKEFTPNAQVRYPCVDLNEYYNEPRSIRRSAYIKAFYHVIDDCPSVILSLDYPKCSNPQGLEDYVFVSDHLTGRVYKNKDCAKCHGVRQYVEWELVTDCPIKSEGLSREEWYSHVMRSCMLTPMPSDTLISQAFKCFHPALDVRRCNATGTWKRTDAQIERACELESPLTNAIYYYERSNLGRSLKRYAYQNAYCKLCNPLDNEEWTDLCVDLLSQDESRFTSPFGFTVVINFGKPKGTSLGSQCEQGQLWDPFQKVCMPVTCPTSSELRKGKCEDMYKRFPGETYEIAFRINSSRPSRFSLTALKDMHYVITDFTNNRFCYPCSSQYVIEIGKSDVTHVVHAVKATKFCTEAYLIQQIKMMERNPLSYFSSALSSDVTLVPDLYIKFNQLIQQATRYEANACPNGYQVDWKFTDRCPRIPLTYTKLNTTTLVFETEKNGSVCLDEYFDIMRSTSTSYHIKQINLFLNVLVLMTFAYALTTL